MSPAAQPKVVFLTVMEGASCFSSRENDFSSIRSVALNVNG